MANEIWHSYGEEYTLYALIWRQTDDKVYDAVAAANTFDTYTDADIDDYDVPLTNHADSDYHSVDFPASITAGIYYVQIFHQIGAIDADADVPVGQGVIDWSGSAEINLTSLDTLIDLIVAKLPDDYIMGSSVTDPMDDEINVIVANTGKVVYGSVSAGTSDRAIMNGSVTGYVEDEKL